MQPILTYHHRPLSVYCLCGGPLLPRRRAACIACGRRVATARWYLSADPDTAWLQRIRDALAWMTFGWLIMMIARYALLGTSVLLDDPDYTSLILPDLTLALAACLFASRCPVEESRPTPASRAIRATAPLFLLVSLSQTLFLNGGWRAFSDPFTTFTRILSLYEFTWAALAIALSIRAAEIAHLLHFRAVGHLALFGAFLCALGALQFPLSEACGKIATAGVPIPTPPDDFTRLFDIPAAVGRAFMFAAALFLWMAANAPLQRSVHRRVAQ